MIGFAHLINCSDNPAPDITKVICFRICGVDTISIPMGIFNSIRTAVTVAFMVQFIESYVGRPSHRRSDPEGTAETFYIYVYIQIDYILKSIRYLDKNYLTNSFITVK